MGLQGISATREIQLFDVAFVAVVNAFGIASTIKLTTKALEVPDGKFWFPIECRLRKDPVDLPITTEEMQVVLKELDTAGVPRTYNELVPEEPVDNSGAAIWPQEKLRFGGGAGDSEYHGVMPNLMRPGDQFQMIITNDPNINIGKWFGRFKYLEIISADANRAYELFYQYTRGLRKISINFEQRRVRP